MNAPTTVDSAVAALDASGGRPRAGGTDLTALVQLRRAAGPFVDLHRVAALRGITWSDGAAVLGAATTIADIAADPALRAAYPALTATAGALATPQIRAVATVGGNLLQRNRCAYFRNPRFDCHQTGGDSCPARAGDHHHGTVIDPGPCVAPHPSSLATALLCHDATIRLADGTELALDELYDAADPTRDHQLGDGRLLSAIALPPPVPGENGAYHRATGRAAAEWPLVEVAARASVADGVITHAAVAAGAVARTPVRLVEVEQALAGRPANEATLEEAVAAATARCAPLPQTGHKVTLLRATVREVLEGVVDGA